MTNRTGPRLRFLRNNNPHNFHFLAVRLTGNGTTCNRDAIGARVELYFNDPAATPMLRTLRAGEGFLAQSSKWIHFGLGENQTVRSLVVRFPDKSQQTFGPLKADQFYLIDQGKNQVRVWTPPVPPVPPTPSTATSVIKPSPLTVPPDTDKAQITLTSGLPIPAMRITDFDGQAYELKPPFKTVFLLNIWATWCIPCRSELNDLKANASKLRAHGIEVLALNVDGLDHEHAGTGTDPKAYLEKMQFPFPGALADARCMDVLNAYQTALFRYPVTLSLPTSFLIGRDGSAMAVYRGPLSVSRLIADARLIYAPPKMRRMLSVPGRGRWTINANIQHPQAVIQALKKAGLTPEAGRYQKRYADPSDQDDSLPDDVLH